jgi:hypothetical protein
LGAFGRIEVLNQTATSGSNSYMAFSTRGGDVMAERMRIDSAGNVGIGTASPWSQLSVSTPNAGTLGYLGFKDVVLGGDVRFGKQDGASNNAVSGTWTNNDYLFYTNSTERARIDSSGNLLVGTTSAFGSQKICVSFDGASAGGIGFVTTTNNTYNAAKFYNSSGSQVGNISVTASTTSYNTSSDYRLKEDWVAVADASTRVNALKPVNFAWKLNGSRVDGFLAHELAEVVPEAVTGEKDAVDAEGKPVYQGIDQSKLVPLLTAALQEALAKIESLEARLDAANI